MPGKLIKYGRGSDFPGAYELKGGLQGIGGPGRRHVTRIIAVDELNPENMPDGLAGFSAFPDLRELSIHGVDGLDTAELHALPLTSLQITGGRACDLRWLDDHPFPTESLALGQLSAPLLPERLRLPESLTGLYLEFITDDQGSCLLQDILNRIDWSRLANLERFSIASASKGAFPRYEISQLRQFPKLVRFAVHNVVPTEGGEPVTPPYSGQPRTLKELVGASKFELPHVLELEAEQLRGAPDASAEQEAYQRIGDQWSIDIAFADLEDGDESVTEAAALRRAKARLKDVDAALLERLDFDQESDSTFVTAERREDLEAAVAIWGTSDRA